MKRWALLFAFVLLAPFAYADNVPQSPVADPNAIRRCQSYLDCTLVWSGCADIAINKKYFTQFKQSTTCDASTMHNPEAVPTCTDGLCVVVVPDEKK